MTYKVEMHSDEKANSVIKNHIVTAEADYSYIRNKIETHGNVIIKRWKKKSPKKRKQMLCDAMPNLPVQRHADIDLNFEKTNFVSDCLNGRMNHEKFDKHEQRLLLEEPYLLPFLDAESLSEDPKRLLALTHYRAHAHLSDWISFDKEIIQVYFHGGAIKAAYNPRCVIVHGKEFGTLVPWSKDAAHRWTQIGYPLGHKLLQMQASIASLLRKTIDELLGCADNETCPGRDVWDRLVSTSFQNENCFVVQSAYYNQAFAPPPKFDLHRILNALKVRGDAALDEAHLVQADSIYLRSMLDQTKKSLDYSLRNPDEKRKLLFVTSIRSSMNHSYWSFLYVAAGRLAKYANTDQDCGQLRLSLTDAYERALVSLEAALIVRFEDLVDDLSNFIGYSRSFRHHFNDAGQQITSPEVAYREDPLFWVLIELAAQNTDVSRPASWCFSFIDEHLSRAGDEKERARIDQTLYDHLSDMALVDEILTAVKSHKLYSPLPRKSEYTRQVYNDFHSGTLSEAFLALLVSCISDLEIETALREFHQLPLSQKISNKEKLAQNFALHQKFRTYWDVVRRHMLAQLQVKEWEPGEKMWLMNKLEEYSKGSPDIFEAAQEAIRGAILRDEKNSEAAKVAFAKAFVTPFQAAAEGHTGRKIAKSVEPKAKIKSRPQSTVVDAVASKAESSSITNSTSPTSHIQIGVNAKSVSFFRRMFSTSEPSQGRLDWQDLLAAMVDAGCSASHSGGSAVTFQDEKNKKGSIVIHKPHLETTIDHIMLKAIGKRLTKWFGWVEDTFIAAKDVSGMGTAVPESATVAKEI